jgi:AcrR family transcriptional regulator
MSLKFDAIAALPTPEQQRRTEALQQGRAERQARAVEVRRVQLLDVAWDVLQEFGVAGFNMRTLGLRAGYTAGAMYGYFTSRDDILLALRERWLETLQRSVERALPPRRVRRTGPARVAGVRSPSPPDPHTVKDARESFLLRSEAWWGALAQAPYAVPLLLLSPSQPASAKPMPTVLEALVSATRICVEDLEAAGWHAEDARRLHREAVCLGVGLIVVGGASDGATASDGFRATLTRWLAQPAGESRPTGSEVVAGQPDLFTGSA